MSLLRSCIIPKPTQVSARAAGAPHAPLSPPLLSPSSFPPLPPSLLSPLSLSPSLPLPPSPPPLSPLPSFTFEQVRLRRACLARLRRACLGSLRSPRLALARCARPTGAPAAPLAPPLLLLLLISHRARCARLFLPALARCALALQVRLRRPLPLPSLLSSLLSPFFFLPLFPFSFFLFFSLFLSPSLFPSYFSDSHSARAGRHTLQIFVRTCVASATAAAATHCRVP